MLSRKTIEYYLNQSLGEPKYTNQGLKYNCKKCDHGNKYNLEINISGRGFVNCWSCGLSGNLKSLFFKYAKDASWKNLPEFKETTKTTINEIVKDLNYPTKTIPFHMNEKVLKYLTEERKIDRKELIRRNVTYAYSENELYFNNICFPFYKDGKLVGACLQDLDTKKYRNLGPLNFVPYEEFVNPYYPITITEGCYDALVSINAIPILKTVINKETLKEIVLKDVLIIDEFDESKITLYSSDWKQKFILPFLKTRLETILKATIFISNKRPEELGEKFEGAIQDLISRETVDTVLVFNDKYAKYKEKINVRNIWNDD